MSVSGCGDKFAEHGGEERVEGVEGRDEGC